MKYWGVFDSEEILGDLVDGLPGLCSEEFVKSVADRHLRCAVRDMAQSLRKEILESPRYDFFHLCPPVVELGVGFKDVEAQPYVFVNIGRLGQWPDCGQARTVW